MFGNKNKKDFTIQPIISSKSFSSPPNYVNILQFNSIPTREITCKIAVIDSGVDGTHYELLDDLKMSKDYTGDIEAGVHGTGVAGCISGDSYGIADVAHLMSYKALSHKSGSGSFRGIARAIEQARVDGADIINLSLGAQVGSAEVSYAIDKFLSDPKRIIVCAAGNDGSATDYPGWLADKYINLITVGAGRIISKSRAELAQFSSRGVVTVTAQGIDVLTTVPNNTFSYMSGTSFAAPLTCACIGLAKTLIPNLNGHDIHKLFCSSGSVIDMMNAGRDTYTGYGFLLPYGFYKNVIRMKDGDIPRPEVRPTTSKVSWFTKLICMVNPMNWVS